jgi:hypothetical protein
MIFIITELLSIDLLDTSGDWLQFISMLVLSWIVPAIIVNFMNFYNYSSKISSIVLAIVLWKVVYDYDYIFGVLAGSVIGIIWACSKHNNKADENVKKPWGSTLFYHILNGLVMLLKILLFII